MLQHYNAYEIFQLWTLYLDEYSKNNVSNSENINITINILLEFWCKVTPCILQLLTHRKVVSILIGNTYLLKTIGGICKIMVKLELYHF